MVWVKVIILKYKYACTARIFTIFLLLFLFKCRDSARFKRISRPLSKTNLVFWFLFLIFALIFIIPLHCSFQYQVFIFGKKIFAVHALIVWIVFYDFLIKCNSFNEQIGGFSFLHYNWKHEKLFRKNIFWSA